jgi:hypothetical protein
MNHESLQKYHKMREDENIRHERELCNLRKDYEAKLHKEQTNHEERLKLIEGWLSSELAAEEM